MVVAVLNRSLVIKRSSIHVVADEQYEYVMICVFMIYITDFE